MAMALILLLTVRAMNMATPPRRSLMLKRRPRRNAVRRRPAEPPRPTRRAS